MALSIFNFFNPRANPADSDYPTGSIKDRSAPGVDDGTPLESEWANDQLGCRDALLAQAQLTASGNADTVGNSQVAQAVVEIGAGRGSLHVITGAANTYVASPNTSAQAIQSLFTGLIISATFAAANTGASTIDVSGLGAKSIKRAGGVALQPGDVFGFVTLQYDGSEFIILYSAGASGLGNSIIDAGENANGRYTLFADGTQLCTSNILTTDGSGDVTWTYPKDFGGFTPQVDPSVSINNPRPVFNYAAPNSASTNSTSSVIQAYQWNGTSFGVGVSVTVRVTAIGRAL